MKTTDVRLIDRIVGDADDGQTFTPEEFEEYKRNVLPMVNCNVSYMKNLNLSY